MYIFELQMKLIIHALSFSETRVLRERPSRTG